MEFQVNEYITLKLEEEKTIIYMVDEKFIQCKFVIFNIDSVSLENTEAIDELLNLGVSDLNDDVDNIKVSPKERFWVHCSSLQAWSEHKYNTALLDSYLAFPILKKLTEVGDVNAQRVFKEEIAKKLRSKVPQVLRFLLREGYATYLDQEELLFSTLNDKEAEAVLEISRSTNYRYYLIFDFDDLREFFVDIYRGYDDLHDSKYYYSAFNGNANEIEILLDKKHPFIPESLGDLNHLRRFYLYIDNVGEVPEFSIYLESLTHLKIFCFGKVILPNIINYFPNLKSLDIYGDISGLTHLEIDDAGIEFINKITHSLKNVIFKMRI